MFYCNILCYLISFIVVSIVSEIRSLVIVSSSIVTKDVTFDKVYYINDNDNGYEVYRGPWKLFAEKYPVCYVVTGKVRSVKLTKADAVRRCLLKKNHGSILLAGYKDTTTAENELKLISNISFSLYKTVKNQ